MRDIWSFLLQTLTASGVAVLLLAVKAMLRDKLPPKWHFASWSVLAWALLLPAGLGGRYVLFNWRWVVETLKTLLTGSVTITHVQAPVPLPSWSAPSNAADWLYVVYVLGVAVLLLRYLYAYGRLRLALHRGIPADEKRQAQLAAVAERYQLRTCTAVEVSGLTSAFVCGVLHPVLALPAGQEVDDKVLLHELLHLASHDSAWGMVICLFRCLHWCNPLIWYCADQAGNDLEARCDQRVLERIEGEERRDYGRILLSMASETYACSPGTSSMANGGKNIRRRIEAIARFKRYPAGMALVSVCMLVLLLGGVTVGARAESIYVSDGTLPQQWEDTLSMASARAVWCSTPDGAMDTYAKAVLTQNGAYRAMCAPEEEQIALLEEIEKNRDRQPRWDGGISTKLSSYPNQQMGYCMLNPRRDGNGYLATLIVDLNYPPEGQARSNEMDAWLALQRLRVEKQQGRWVVLPQEDFRAVKTSRGVGQTYLTNFGLAEGEEWDYIAYADSMDDIRVEVRYMTSATMNRVSINDFYPTSFIDSMVNYSTFDLTPKPAGEFNDYWAHQDLVVIVPEAEAYAPPIRWVGVSASPMESLKAQRPELKRPLTVNSGGGDSDGGVFGSSTVNSGQQEVKISGGANSGHTLKNFQFPKLYAAELYINGVKTADLTLLPEEGES